MQLIELKITSFGQLKNRTFQFAPGLSVIAGENEQGKSTLLNCLKAMFYGFSGTKRAIRDNERTRFMPWDGSPMAANLTFEHAGIRYRLERVFGKTKAGDQCRLMLDVSGQGVERPSQQEIGQMLFQVTEEEFTNTVFIGQLQSPLEGPDDSTLGKLGNLAGSLDEKLSYAALDEKLREAQKVLKLERGVGGLIPDLQQKIRQLESDRQTAILNESEQLNRLTRLNDIKQHVDESELEKARLTQHLEGVQAQNSVRKLGRLKTRREEQLELESELEREQIKLLIGGQLIDRQAINQLRVQLIETRKTQADATNQHQKVGVFRSEIEREEAALRGFSAIDGLDRITLQQLTLRREGLQSQIRLQKDALRFQNLNGQVMQAKAQLADRKTAEQSILDEQHQLPQAEWLFPDAMTNTMTNTVSNTMTHKVPNTPEDQYPNSSPDNSSQTAKTSRNFLMIVAWVLIAIGVIGTIFITQLAVIALTGIVLAIVAYRQINRARQAFDADRQAQFQAQANRQAEDTQSAVRKAELAQQLQAMLETRLNAARDLTASAQQAYNSLNGQLQALIAEISAESMTLVIDLGAIAQAEQACDQIQDQIEAALHKSGDISLTDLYIQLSQADSLRQSVLTRQKDFKKETDLLMLLDNAAAQKWRQLALAITPDNGLVDVSLPAAIETQIENLALIETRCQGMAEKLQQIDKTLLESTGGLTWNEFVQQAEALLQKSETAKLSDLNDIDLEVVDLEALNQTIQNLAGQLADWRVAISGIESAIRHSSQMPKMAIEYDELILNHNQRLNDAQAYFDALDLARKNFTAAYEELQETFGPVLNEKAAFILEKLTGGKYSGLKIDRRFNVKVEAPEDGRFHEWDYYSGGTIDQIYLALRLAVSDLITAPNQKMPLLLDDIFVQYDDERTKSGLKFLFEKVAAEHGQALLLTSHNRIGEMAQIVSPAILVQKFT